MWCFCLSDLRDNLFGSSRSLYKPETLGHVENRSLQRNLVGRVFSSGRGEGAKEPLTGRDGSLCRGAFLAGFHMLPGRNQTVMKTDDLQPFSDHPLLSHFHLILLSILEGDFTKCQLLLESQDPPFQSIPLPPTSHLLT